MSYVVSLVTVAALASLWSMDVHVHRNVSASLPISNYVAYRVYRPFRVGDLVEACPPLGAAVLARTRGYVPAGDCPGGTVPLLKLVAAVGGDTVAVTRGAVLVNSSALPNTSAIEFDAKKRPVRSWFMKSRRLRDGELWLYGTASRSFDSRKFGPVATSNVRALAWAALAPLPNLLKELHAKRL